MSNVLIITVSGFFFYQDIFSFLCISASLGERTRSHIIKHWHDASYLESAVAVC